MADLFDRDRFVHPVRRGVRMTACPVRHPADEEVGPARLERQSPGDLDPATEPRAEEATEPQARISLRRTCGRWSGLGAQRVCLLGLLRAHALGVALETREVHLIRARV